MDHGESWKFPDCVKMCNGRRGLKFLWGFFGHRLIKQNWKAVERNVCVQLSMSNWMLPQMFQRGSVPTELCLSEVYLRLKLSSLTWMARWTNG